MDHSPTTRSNRPALEWVPDACTLPSIEQPLRVAEFDALFVQVLTDATLVTATNARLVLTGVPEIAMQVRSLAERETDCCSFFTFDVTPTTDGAVLNITVPLGRTDVLSALVDRAQAARVDA